MDYNKEFFGLPVFTITIMEDMPHTFIDFMSMELYVSLDTSEEQLYHQKMNFLNDIIAKCGCDDTEW